MSDLEELYQEIVMEHNRQPRNFREPEGANRSANGFNPFCGDMVTLFLKVDDDDTIADVGFQGSGCAISKASASMLTESVKGRSTPEAARIFEAFHRMLTDGSSDLDSEVLGDLQVLSGVSEFPTRIKCATLAWHALNSALDGREETVKTE